MASDHEGERRAVNSVQSVDRAVSVLEILAREGEVGVTEIAAELGVHKSTAFRLLGVLEDRGLVGQTEDRGKYHLGLGIIRLAGATAARLDVTQESRTVCEQLAREVGETVNVAISDLEAGAAVNVTQARGTAAVTSQNWVGRRTPLHATSSGKVLLAHMPPDHVRRALARRLEGFTDHTITSTRKLREELVTVAERGFASCVEELEIGLNALAAPIRSYEGQVVAAISISGPSYRLTPERLPEVAEQVVAAGREVSRRMGFA
ncbi:DNA-binding IclR family transcriptional regulator [Crossiella equi]|uniref:DNA-binding IclR family transcriptional regulator n=1 Tax=Crossiella equi TaxID=130796 RepID=A0ABS5ASA2_9PSEU|nr:IclR family transcriptional regulator [Crossiella equi]MBP2479277.1 DNA-binding IclR family transcriptional regulator [Crossiella equi]